ncbi:MAG: response regulator [Desulfuromonadales bacterium]|nr:response regulator [Desulfuromonadales bacterium]MDW7756213.1 response regulator [Desulfuromonadales bacterium]
MSKKLLLADDSITIQKVISITFANEDYDLIVVDNGDAALEKARTSHPDLVLADVFMPGKNGYELCAAIKQEGGLKGVPVLLLTGTFEPFDENKASACGADGWIAKPFESQALIRKVEELLAAADDIVAEIPEMEDAAAPLSEPSGVSAPVEDIEADMWEELVPAAVAPAAPSEPSGAMEGEDGVAADEDLWSDVSFDDEELDQPAATDQADEDLWQAETEVLGDEETETDTLAEHPVEEATLEDFGFEVEGEEGWQDEESPSPVAAPEDLMSAEASDDLWGDEPEGLGEAGEQSAPSETSAAGVDLMSAEAEEDVWGTYEAPASESEPAEDEVELEDILALSDEDILEEADLADWDDEDLLSESPEDALDAGSEETTAGEETSAAPFEVPSSTEEMPAPFEETAPVAEEGLLEEALFDEPAPETPVASAPAAAAAPAVSEAEVARIVERVAAEVVERLAGTILEKIAWDVVPDLAESLIKEEIRQIKEGAAQ